MSSFQILFVDHEIKNSELAMLLELLLPIQLAWFLMNANYF